MTLESMSRAGGSTGAPAEPPRLHPSIALAPYVEALVVGRRVAVLGDATLGLADALLARGARLVHAYDPDPARVAEAIARKAPAFGSPAAGRPAARGVVHALLGDDLGVRDGAFDAVLIPDLSRFGDRTDVVRRAKKLCAPTGAVVVASPNPDAKRRLLGGPRDAGTPGYYELFDLLTLQFPVVRMVGQAPFVGYAIVDFAPDREPDVAFDASLMAGTEEPEIFVAIASERPIATDAYLVVEVPAEDVLAHLGAGTATSVEAMPSGPSSAREELRGPGADAQLAEARARLVLMEAELEDLRSQKADLARQVEAARKAEGEADARARDAGAEAARGAEAQAERWRELEARAGDEHVRAERLTHKVRDLEEELVRQRDRAQKLTKALDDEKRAKQKAEIELGMARGLPKPDEGAAARAEELAAELSRANARVEELAAEIGRGNAHAEQLATELRQARSRADGLAHELLAKSKETAELRREHEAAAAKGNELAHALQVERSKGAELAHALHAEQSKGAELAHALQVAQSRIVDLEEDQVRTLRRPEPVREPIITTAEVDTGVATRLAKLTAEANAERRMAEESKRALDIMTEQRDAARERAKQLEVSLEHERAERKDLVMAKATLEAEAMKLRRRIDELALEREAEAGPEVVQLEAALRDRGHKIAALERDLRESERIGRELIAEIEALREEHGGGDGGTSLPGQGAPPAGGQAQGARASAAQAAPGAIDALSADAFQHRIDALAADAAQKQAELLSSAWKIQALERELSEARSALRDPSTIQRELSNALVRAQSEIAELRRGLSASGREGTGVPRAVVEDAVLLHQQMAR